MLHGVSSWITFFSVKRFTFPCIFIEVVRQGLIKTGEFGPYYIYGFKQSFAFTTNLIIIASLADLVMKLVFSRVFIGNTFQERWKVFTKALYQSGLTFLPLHVMLWEFCLFVFWRYLVEKWRFFSILFFEFYSLNMLPFIYNCNF